MESENKSFIEYDKLSDFPIQNIPFGVYRLKGTSNIGSCCSAIGVYAIDLAELENQKYFQQDSVFQTAYTQYPQIFSLPSLNTFMSLAPEYWSRARHIIQTLLAPSSPLFKDLTHFELTPNLQKIFIKLEEVELLLPAKIGDYTDFYSSKNHAFNMGCMIRGKENALQENWLHLPVGYHGRASSVVVSGTNIHRARGQIKAPSDPLPTFQESKKMDFELEVGAFLGGKLNELGSPISIKDAANNIFGLVLLNDWSVRDVQGWEYVPLGPFTAKNLGTIISPWIVTTDALKPFKLPLPEQNPKPLPYLQDPDYSSYDMVLEVYLETENSKDLISMSNFKYLYWSISQQLSHHTVTGCNMNPADLLGSGTISGTEEKSFGSLMELSWNGKNPITLSNGETRTFLKDGDTIVMKAFCQNENCRIGFGECRSKILPAKNINQQKKLFKLKENSDFYRVFLQLTVI